MITPFISYQMTLIMYNDTAVSPIHTHSSGVKIPSNSSTHYISPEKQLGSSWPTDLKRGQKRPTGWQVVSYIKPVPVLTADQENEKRRSREKRLAFMEATMKDPVRRYWYERNQEINRVTTQLQKDHRYSGWSKTMIRDHVSRSMSRDREPVVINPISDEDRDMGITSAHKRRRGTRRDAIIERRAEEGDLKQKMFDREFIDKIRQARERRSIVGPDMEERQMTQRDVAVLVNVKPSVINDFESGNLAFDGALKAKLIWKLGL